MASRRETQARETVRGSRMAYAIIGQGRFAHNRSRDGMDLRGSPATTATACNQKRYSTVATIQGIKLTHLCASGMVPDDPGSFGTRFMRVLIFLR